jgi:hypothetical protein
MTEKGKKVTKSSPIRTHKKKVHSKENNHKGIHSKKSNKTLIITLLVVISLLFLSVMNDEILFLRSGIEPSTINTEPETHIPPPQEKVQDSNDFPSSEQGTFMAQTKNTYFKEPIDPIVVLLTSAKVSGLTLVYSPGERKLIGGTPQIVAENIDLFDGIAHEVGYAFNRNGKQTLLYDGNVVAESDFVSYGNFLTGNVAGASKFTVSESISTATIS